MLGSVYRVRHTATIVGAFDDPIAVIDNGFAPLWRRAQHGFEGKAPGVFAGVAPAPVRVVALPRRRDRGRAAVRVPSLPAGHPERVPPVPDPMLATLGEAPSGEGWAFEFKWGWGSRAGRNRFCENVCVE